MYNKEDTQNKHMTVQKEVNLGTRLGSMILDHFIMTMIAMIFFLPALIKSFASAFEISHEQMQIDFGGPVSFLGFALYFCKDIINGRSIAKRITKLQVVDNASGNPASPLKCFVRNIFCVIWPIEVIATLNNPQRRIGDRVAGTKVVVFDPISIEQPTFRITQAILPLMLSVALLFIFLLPFRSLTPNVGKVDYLESSYNERESKAIERLFRDSLGQNLKASVKVYDKIKDQDLKYISIVYILNEDYMADDKTSSQLQQATHHLLYSKYPKESFTGREKYIFQTEGRMHSNSQEIGTIFSLSRNSAKRK